MSRILMTDNGTHPPEKWAMVTAETIFDIDSGVAGDRLIQAKKLQIAIAEALMPHHANSQQTEQVNLAKDVSNIHTAFSSGYLNQAMFDVVKAAEGTPWENHFLKHDVQMVVRAIIDDHFKTARHIERLWHAEKHPDCEVSQQYKARFHGDSV